MSIQVLDFTGKKKSELQAPKALDLEINQHLIWEAVTAEQANARQGTHKTKERGEVSGGGKKPWKQKGTGRARQGSIRSPIWKGGGTTFGPRPRDYSKQFSRRKKRTALLHIIAGKIKENTLVVLEEWKQEKVGTKEAFQGFDLVVKAAPFYEAYSKGKKMRAGSNENRRKVTVVTANATPENKQSVRNIPWIEMIDVNRLAAQPLFYNHGLIFTKEAFDEFSKRADAK